MSTSSNDSSHVAVVHISYEYVLQKKLRESATYLYEIACSLVYPATSAHLSLRVTGQNTYRNAAAKDIPFTLHDTGATAYIELLEAEQFEIRIVEQGGIYSKAFYLAQKRELMELNSRHIVSHIQCLNEDH
ncbi:MAG TPA: hypothetical protein VL485_31630 [Ktedonobacteraceae bacterium]|jgi:hypothetical protein|nr:hypothetical protein [Ktedonobacteraceae bacterium]